MSINNLVSTMCVLTSILASSNSQLMLEEVLANPCCMKDHCMNIQIIRNEKQEPCYGKQSLNSIIFLVKAIPSG